MGAAREEEIKIVRNVTVFYEVWLKGLCVAHLRCVSFCHSDCVLGQARLRFLLEKMSCLAARGRKALISVIAIACLASTSAFSVGMPRSLASRPILGSAVRQPGGGLEGLPLEARATRVQGHLRQGVASAAVRTSHVNMAMDGQGSRVVIVGGGFGGLYTALNLAKLAPLQEEAKAKPDITLIDTSDR